MKKKINILDVGSDRDFIKKVVKLCNLAQVNYLVIDPQPNYLQKFKDENKHIKNLKLRFLRYCVSEKNIKKKFYLNSDLTTSSYFKSNQKLLDLIRDDNLFENRKILNIKTHKLDRVLNIRSIKNLDLITLCTQGSELDILKGSGKILQNISLIRVHKDWEQKYKNEPLIGDLIQFLNSKGFKLLDIKPANKWFDKNITSDILFLNKKILSNKNKNNSLSKTISILISLGKITDVLVLSKTSDLSTNFIKNQIKNYNILYNSIIKYYPYSKLILYFSNSIFLILRILGIKKNTPSFFALFKFLKENKLNDKRRK